MHKTPNIKGFTIVEMMVVVAVLGILIALTTFATRGWQQSIDQRQIYSDLNMAAIAMENVKNFGSGYPDSLPEGFRSGTGVNVTYAWGDSAQYCLQGVSNRDNTVVYHIESSIAKTVEQGSCSPGVSTPPDPTLALSVYSLGSSRWQYNVRATSSCNNGSIQFMVDNVLSTSTANPMPDWSNNTWLNATSGSEYSGSITPVASQTAPNNYMWFMAKARCVAGTQIKESASFSRDKIAGVPLVPPSSPSPAPTVAASAMSNYRSPQGIDYARYTVTAGSSTCSSAQLEWKIYVSPTSQSPASSPPTWSSVSATSSNSVTVDIIFNRLQNYRTVYVKPVCTNTNGSTDHASFASVTLSNL